MTSLETIQKQLRKAMRVIQAFRAVEPRPAFKVITAAELAAEPLRDYHEPAPDDPRSEVYEAALRLWALQVAPQITGDDFDAICEWLEDECTWFSGDRTRFLENLFEGLTLKDGFTVWP